MHLIYELFVVSMIVAVFAALISFPLLFKVETEHEDQD
jgi:hypothetical protein